MKFALKEPRRRRSTGGSSLAAENGADWRRRLRVLAVPLRFAATDATVAAIASVTTAAFAPVTAALAALTPAFIALVAGLAAFRGALTLAARLGGWAGFARATDLLVALAHGGARGEADAAFLIHAQALDPDLITEFDDVFGLLDSEIGQLADVDQAVFAR